MEYSKNGLDLLIWPREWHKKFNTTLLLLIPLCFSVGIFDVLNSDPSAIKKYLMAGETGLALRVPVILLISAAIGFVDVLGFAWPVADLIRLLGKRTEKFVAPGLHIVLMKSYAVSHLVLVPFLVLSLSTGLQANWFNPQTRLYSFLIILMVVWQIGILLRTVSVKTKLETPAKLLVAAAIYFWFTFEGVALGYLLRFFYELFGVMEKIS